MKKKLLIPLLIFAPLALMANSPAPWTPPQPYEDFEITIVDYTLESAPSNYKYTAQISNYGNQYLILNRLYGDRDDYHIDHPSNVYYDQCLAPGDSGTYFGYCDGNYAEVDFEFHAYAVAPTSEVTPTKVSFREEKATDDNYSVYYLDIEGVSLPDNKHYYSSLFELTIDGEKVCYYSTDTSNTHISFDNKKGLNPNNIKLNKMYLVQGREKNNGYAFLSFLFGAFYLLVGFGGVSFAVFTIFVASMLLFVIIPGVVILIVRPWKKKEKKKE